LSYERRCTGTGSTAYYAIERIGQKLRNGELSNLKCIPSSERTKKQALGLDIPLTTLDETSRLDVSIDGADDVDLNCNLIKGAGGEPMPYIRMYVCMNVLIYFLSN
jgi:ribose 5-phosphate isomerase A